MTDTPARPWWRRFVCHPVFPFFIYLGLTQAIRDNYPFSHYPMYSKPNSESLSFQYLADGDGKPLPLKWHTGITPSQLSKRYRESKRHNPADEAAALEVLGRMREQNDLRKGRALPERIQLMEDNIRFAADGTLVENKRSLAIHTAPNQP